jgi:hypothetical protein
VSAEWLNAQGLRMIGRALLGLHGTHCEGQVSIWLKAISAFLSRSFFDEWRG